jgi:phosphatidylethanolamine-binding protein (PEBP) family uncharacterized protein
LYALGRDGLDLPKKVSLEAFTKAVEPNVLAAAKIVGTFTKIGTA